MNIFNTIMVEIHQAHAIGRKPVAVAMAWDYFCSEEMASAFTELGWEDQYVYITLHPEFPFEMCGLPVAIYHGQIKTVEFNWALATVLKT